MKAGPAGNVVGIVMTSLAEYERPAGVGVKKFTDPRPTSLVLATLSLERYT
jgi:hypothetical protein